MGFLADTIPDLDLEWPDCDLSSFTEAVIGATICGRVLEHKQEPPARTRDAAYDFCRRHRSLSALLAQRIKTPRMAVAAETMDPILTFTALSAHMAVLLLHDLVDSNPLGAEAQAIQLTRALQDEHRQQALDAVANTALLVTALGQHFQVRNTPSSHTATHLHRTDPTPTDSPPHPLSPPPRRPLRPVPPRPQRRCHQTDALHHLHPADVDQLQPPGPELSAAAGRPGRELARLYVEGGRVVGRRNG